MHKLNLWDPFFSHLVAKKLMIYLFARMICSCNTAIIRIEVRIDNFMSVKNGKINVGKIIINKSVSQEKSRYYVIFIESK